MAAMTGDNRADASHALAISEEDGLLLIEGQCRASARIAAPPTQKGARPDPFPQALDSKPDPIFAEYPQVAADSKPHLAEMVSAQARPPMAT